MKKVVRTWAIILAAVFVLLNGIAALHAYKFTHFSHTGVRNEQLELSLGKKLQLLCTGVDNPRPQNTTRPHAPYETITISSNVLLEGWKIRCAGKSKGTVILFHGYTSNKSSLLGRAGVFLGAGYNCVVMDFMGSGGSGGDRTTIGYVEAREVTDCYHYVSATTVEPIFLYGASMGAVAIIKAIHDDHLAPRAVILDCPFATMYDAVAARFRMLHAPEFPMANLLVFWGGVENGFPGFGFRPVDDASAVQCPALLEWGQKDDRVSRKETDAVYARLVGPRTLKIYATAGHDDYETTCPGEWSQTVTSFLSTRANK